MHRQPCRGHRASLRRRLDGRHLVVLGVIAAASSVGTFPYFSAGVPVHGFAYAPNFITKIIEQSTGIPPVGLLDVGGGSSGGNSDDADETAAAETAATTVVADECASADPFGGPITTRFPPEPNGYLHLGHAKAVSFNFAVARAFAGGSGRCHMRLDDTNPTKEDEEYVASILEDVRWIQSGMEGFGEDGDAGELSAEDAGPWFGPVRKTSDYFHLIYDMAVHLIKTGDAYVDELNAEEMREYRGTLTEPGKESPHRNRSAEESLDLFQRMREGEFDNGRYSLRAKIDMASPNLNLRDPIIYRIKKESHQATGDEWCIYPMYDFSHPLADAVEGVTHSLCTLEFEDHRPLYDWVADRARDAESIPIEASPRQIEFSRLNVKYTVLSKRKLIKLVEDNHVTGWDDPRMPTLSGMRRRGVPPSAIRMFCERAGISKSDSNIDFSNLEDCAREVMDDAGARAFAVLDPLKITIQNWEGELEDFQVPRHPKRTELGERTVPFGKTAYIERSDFFDLNGPEGEANGGRPPRGFKRLLPDGKVRLKYAYVVQCDDIVRDPETNEPVELICTYFPETRAGATPEGEARVKGIVQWVEADTGVKCKVMQYDRLFKTEEPGKESGDFIHDINSDSLSVLDGVVVEPAVAADALKTMEQISEAADGDKLYPSGLFYQFERSGYFALDSSATADSLVFNRVVTLRDTWAAPKQKNQGQANDKQQKQQNAGRGGRGGGGGGAVVVDDVRRVSLRAGTILEAGPHPEADALIVCKLDCGDTNEAGEPMEPRTVVAGLAGKISYDDLIGRKIACLTNLKPAKMRGIESHAMFLAASDGKEGDDELVELLDIPESVPNGELLSFEGMEVSEPDVMLKSKGAVKVWDRVKAKLRVSKDGEATYINDDGAVSKIMTSAGPAKVKSLTDTIIG